MGGGAEGWAAGEGGAGSVDLKGGFRMLRLNLFSMVSLSVRKKEHLPAAQ